MEKKISLDGKVLQMNKQAMDLLHREDYQKSLKILKETEKILNDHGYPQGNELWGITYNNFGCIYKRVGNFKAALFYLSKALEMEIKNSYDATNLASTHLNISAILSSMGKHDNSLVHALAALKTLKSINVKSSNYIVSIVISYHSIGVENEHLRKYNEALAAYRMGWEIAEKELGPEHKLTLTLRKSFTRGSSMPLIPTVKSGSNAASSIIGTSSKNGTRYLNNKRKSHNCDNLPLLRSRNSQKTSYTDPKYTPVNRSSEEKVTRKVYYMNTRKSLSPVSNKASLSMVSDMDTINKLIKELDGTMSKHVSRGRVNYKDLTPQIITIQRWWRWVSKRIKTRKQKSRLKVVKKPKQSNIKITQKDIKLLRPIPETKYEKKIDAVVKIQSWAKMLIQKRKYQEKVRAAITIQKNYRRWMVRKIYNLILSAVIFIQSVYRGHRARKRYKRLQKHKSRFNKN